MQSEIRERGAQQKKCSQRSGDKLFPPANPWWLQGEVFFSKENICI